MDIQPMWLLGVVVLTLLCLLLTGPGLWSEKWGWGWLSRRPRSATRPGEGRPPAAPPSA